MADAVAEDEPLSWQAVLERQDGVISRQQAVAHGLTEDGWRWKLGSGRWQSPVPGVAVAHSGDPTKLELRWVAVLRCGKDAALSGDAALVHFGAKRLTVGRHDVAIPDDRRVRAVAADALCVQPHRIEKLSLWVAGHPHLRLVHATAAALHAAAWASSDAEAEHRLALVVQQQLTTPAALRTTLAQMPRLPRHALVRSVLDDVELGAHAASELDFLRFCRRHHLPVPDQLQVLVRAGGKRYLDARWSWLRITVEVDGAHHMWVEQWNADLVRALQLAVATRGSGEQTIRISRTMLRQSEAEVAAMLRQLLV